jgi:hypothetical protein
MCGIDGISGAAANISVSLVCPRRSSSRPIGATTRLVAETELQPKRVMRLMSSLFGPMMRRTFAKRPLSCRGRRRATVPAAARLAPARARISTRSLEGQGIEIDSPRPDQRSNASSDMAIGIYFAVQGMSAEKYDDVIKQLQDAGQGAPAGRTYHCAFEGENGLQVFDVWDSQEAFDAFGETLMPILGAAGIDPGEPMISPVHNIIIG